jgi:hypothetical protein
MLTPELAIAMLGSKAECVSEVHLTGCQAREIAALIERQEKELNSTTKRLNVFKKAYRDCLIVSTQRVNTAYDLEQERDEALRQVAVMRGALEEIPNINKKLRTGLGAGGKSTGMYLEVELGNVLLDNFTDAFDELMPDALQSTPDRITGLIEALEKLARLGAGDRYGNSDGNVIAQDALRAWKGENHG